MGKYRDQFEDLVKKLMHGNDQDDFLAFIDTLDRRDELFDALRNDVRLAKDSLKEQYQDQYLRRTFIRATFAMIEGLLNVLTQTILEAHKYGFVDLTKDEKEKLTEQVVTKKGLRPNFLSLGKKVQHSFLIFSRKMGGFDYSIDITTKEWTAFESSITIRNQLMHPRVISDLTLDDHQISTVLEASNWFLSQYANLERQVGAMASKRSLENMIKARICGK